MSGAPKTVSLTIDGKAVQVPQGTTLWEAAREVGVQIPVLCHSPRMEPVGVCRMCIVDVGERVLAAACVRKCEEGMTVATDTEEIAGHRKTLTALLLSDYPEQSAREATTGDDELLALARETKADGGDYHRGSGRGADAGGDGAGRGNSGDGIDLSSPVIAVDHRACILCDRCIRACDDLQNNHVIGRTGKGYTARIAFDLNAPMGTSTCVACGECMASCPTGALTNRSVFGLKIKVI